MQRRKPILGLCLAAVALLGGVWFANGQASNAAPQQDQAQAQNQQQGGGGTQDFFPNLVEELKKIDGCLGVEAAQTQSGKRVLFAWFEDKAAAMRWYESEYHQTMMYRFFPNQDFGDAMSEIADDSGPIMAIASLTLATDAKVGELPISQIAIELYGPLKGGLALGGSFAPAAVQKKMQVKKEAAADGSGK
jgi:hypothetical protein